MIRRSPTRIELKLDDIQEFDYVQKYDKKKTTAPATDNGTNLSAAATAKLLRHDRIGLPRPGGSRSGLCLSANCGGGSETATSTQVQPSSSSTTTTATTAMAGATTSTPVPTNVTANDSESGGGSNSNNNDGPESNVDPVSLPSGIEPSDSNDMDLIDFNSTYASANMSMDET